MIHSVFGRGSRPIFSSNQSSLVLYHLWVFLGLIIMIRTIHFLASFIFQSSSRTSITPKIRIVRYAFRYEKNKLNTFWNHIKQYSINVVFCMVWTGRAHELSKLDQTGWKFVQDEILPPFFMWALKYQRVLFHDLRTRREQDHVGVDRVFNHAHLYGWCLYSYVKT